MWLQEGRGKHGFGVYVLSLLRERGLSLSLLPGGRVLRCLPPPHPSPMMFCLSSDPEEWRWSSMDRDLRDHESK